MGYTLEDLELPDDETMVIIRKSMLWICDGDKYAAAALNMYVHWTKWIIKQREIAHAVNTKRKSKGQKPTQNTSLIIYRKQSDLVEDLLGFCSDKRLREANALLKEKELLVIRDNPKNLQDHILQYELQINVFKKKMQEWKIYREQTKKQGEEFDPVEVLEEASREDSNGTDNLPRRNGNLTVPDGQNSSRNGKFSDSNIIDTLIDTLINLKDIAPGLNNSDNNLSLRDIIHDPIVLNLIEQRKQQNTPLSALNPIEETPHQSTEQTGKTETDCSAAPDQGTCPIANTLPEFSPAGGENPVNPPATRKRGRPKGSTNKPKGEVQEPKQKGKPGRPKKVQTPTENVTSPEELEARRKRNENAQKLYDNLIKRRGTKGNSGLEMKNAYLIVDKKVVSILDDNGVEHKIQLGFDLINKVHECIAVEEFPYNSEAGRLDITLAVIHKKLEKIVKLFYERDKRKEPRIQPPVKRGNGVSNIPTTTPSGKPQKSFSERVAEGTRKQEEEQNEETTFTSQAMNVSSNIAQYM